MKKLYGVITAMVTPFSADGHVDLSAVRKHVDFLIDRGVHCLYPLGTTGEMYLMSLEERKLVAQTVVEHNQGRRTCFIHTGAMTMADTVELTRHAREIGADGVGIVSPSYFKVSEREMEEYYVTAAKRVPDDFPVYTYNIPQLSVNDISPDVLERIVKRAPNVIGIKYSLPDLFRTIDYTRVNGGNFSVVQGADTLLTACMMLGCDGLVSGCSSVIPEPYVAAYEAFKSGDMDKAKEKQIVASLASKLVRAGANMSYFKEGLKVRGIDMGHMRKPLLDLEGDILTSYQDEFKAFMEKYGLK